MTAETSAGVGAYRIGAVARLTGISPDTLRIWERRYDIVDPQRTPKGGRLYSQQDVTRLTELGTEYARVEEELRRLVAEWEDLGAALGGEDRPERSLNERVVKR